MAFDFFTIQSLARELDGLMKGITITRACSIGVSPEARRVAPGAESPDLALSWESGSHLAAWLGRGGLLCHVPCELPPQLRATSGPERYLTGATVDSVRPDRHDRLIRMRLWRCDVSGAKTHAELVFELVEPHFQVVLKSEQTHRVLGHWSTENCKAARRIALGEPYAPLPGPQRLVPAENGLSEFLQRLREDPARTLSRALCRVLAGADRWVAGELLYRSGAIGTLSVHEVDDETLGQVWQVAHRMYSQPPAESPEAFVWEEAGRHVFSSLQPLRPVRDLRRCPTVSEAVRLWRQGEERRHAGGMHAGDSGRRQSLERRLRRLEHTCQAMEADLAEAEGAEELERMGSVLMAHVSSLARGQQRVELPDTFDASGQSSVSVDLDPLLSPAENAARYLKRAQKLRRRMTILPERLRQKREEWAELGETLRRLQEGRQEPMSERRIEGGETEATPAAGARRASAPPRPPQAHPRRYLTSSGWSVWVGRNNRENDLLTHKLAAQDDLWFHAQGYSGSHVVLRRLGRRDEPSRRTLHEAAAVAAYWSKGRTAGKVAVVYTPVKYVTKPKGSPPGMAVLRREKTLMVVPALLPQEGD